MAVDQAADRVPDCLVDGIGDRVAGAGGEGVRLHGPPLALFGFDGDEYGVVRHGVAVDVVEGVGAGGIRDEVRGAGNRQRLHQSILPTRETSAHPPRDGGSG
ncbi:hypothetical protein [Streptomyces sp. NPDC001153]